MPPIIPVLAPFDQSTLQRMRAVDPIVQRYRARFTLFDWSDIDPPAQRGPGRPAHPQSAYLKAALVRINEHLLSTPRWRAYLLDHPLLVLELGFRPHLDLRQPYGFDVAKTVPSIRHLNFILRTLDERLLVEGVAPAMIGKLGIDAARLRDSVREAIERTPKAYGSNVQPAVVE